MTKPKTTAAAKGAAKKTGSRPGPETPEGVDQLMAGLDHPHKAAIEALRKIIRGAAPGITEGVKWNAPSFRTTEWFATTHLRSKNGVPIILHLGAKNRKDPKVDISDPEGLLKWLGKDRAMVTFADQADVKSRKAAFVAIVRQWVKFV